MASRRSTARDLAQIAIFAALIAAFGLPGTINLPFAEGVPITLQTLGVMLAGAILGARKGFLAVLTFEVLTFAGLPLLAGGRGGPSWFLSSVSSGFLWGWLPGAALVGLLTGWILPRYRLWLGILMTAAGGMVVIYSIGIPVLAIKAHLSLATAIHANLAFLPGDGAKVIITALVAKQVHRAYPGLIRRRSSRTVTGSTGPLADRLQLGASGSQPAISIGGRSVDYAELQELVGRAREAIGRRPTAGAGPVDLAGLDVVDTLATIFAAASLGVPVLVRGPGSMPPSLPALGPSAFLVVMTSGTSGRPRTVVRTAESWSASFRPLTDLTGLQNTDTVLLTGPLHSTMHLFAAVHTLWLGAHLADDPSVATATHAVPAVLGDLLEDPPGRLRLAVVAGAALPHDLARRSAALGVRLVEYYGAAEMSFVAARVAPEPLRPFPGVEVRITGGELWARSPYLALERIADDSALQRSDLRRSADGFVTVGDLAEIRDDGSIVVQGRGDSAVTTGGHTVLVEDVEAVLSALAGVREVAVVGVDHSRLGQVVTAVIVVADGFDLAQIRREARTALTGPSLPRRWRSVPALPRTAGGKVARGALTGGGPEPKGSR